MNLKHLVMPENKDMKGRSPLSQGWDNLNIKNNNNNNECNCVKHMELYGIRISIKP